MTVSTNEFYTDWLVADGVNKDWPYEFTIFEESSIIVQVRVGLEEAGITDHVNNFTLYKTDDTQGYVRYPTTGDAVETGSYVRLVRNIPYTQTIEIGNEGAFFPALHERAFDQLSMQIQQVANAAARSVKVPLGNDADLANLTNYLIALGAVVDELLILVNNIDDVNTTAADITAIVTVANAIADVIQVAAAVGDIAEVLTVKTEIIDLAALTTEIEALGGISAAISGVYAIQGNVTTVAAIDDEITTVAGVSANVSTVAGISANVTTVAGISANVTSVAGNAANINAAVANAANINAAPQAASDAATARDHAQDWAQAPEDTVVNDGVNPPGYSAYHWSLVAEEAAGGGVTSVAGLSGVVSSAGLKTALDITNVTESVVAGKLAAASNLSDLADASTARANLGLGTIATRNIFVDAVEPTSPAEGDIWMEPQ